jgi:hypothetical protein
MGELSWHEWSKAGQVLHSQVVVGLTDSEAAVNSCKLAKPRRCKNSSIVAKRSGVFQFEFYLF